MRKVYGLTVPPNMGARQVVVGFMLAVLAAIIMLLGGCGGGKGAADWRGRMAGERMTPSPYVADGNFGIPSPNEAISDITRPRTGSAAMLVRQGSEFEAGLAQHAAIDGVNASLSPQWTANSDDFSTLAYAIYRFNLLDYAGDQTLVLTWETPPIDAARLWIGFSRWGLGRWDWYLGPANGIVDLNLAGLSQYSQPGTQDMLVAIVMLGTVPVALHELRIGGGTGVDSWSMFGHDPQHTHRSPYAGPATNALKWSCATLGPIKSSPAIGADGTVYIGSGDGHLYALDPNNQVNHVKWIYPAQGQIGAVNSSPAIGADGTVYVGSDDGNIYAVDPSGNALSYNWPYGTGGAVTSSPAIGLNGTIYVGSNDHYVYALNKYGYDDWIPPFLTGGKVISSPAIGADGTVYVGCDDHKLYAITVYGALVAGWPYATDTILNSSPAIGADGTIYVGTTWEGDFGDLYGYLDAINPNGTRKWQVSLGGHANSSSPAIGADGTVYIGTQAAFLSFYPALYAVRPDGSIKWHHDIGLAGDYDTMWNLAVDKDGSVYVGCSSNDWMSVSNFYAFDQAGAQKWILPLAGDLISCPAIGANGTVYVGCSDNSLYAFGP